MGHAGKTASSDKTKINILYDAEIRDVGTIQKLCWLCSCRVYDKERSYIYVRENSVETNTAFRHCLIKSMIFDNVDVYYFDAPPFQPQPNCTCCAGFGCPLALPCCGFSNPKLEVKQSGCYCCTKKFECGADLVVMPYEQLPPPCCCCSN